jgi:hypothetical protein
MVKRRIALGMLGLALAGCAQSRSAMPGKAQPVGMDPIPSLRDTINRGTGDQTIQQASLPDPKSPNWSGEYAPSTGPGVGVPGGQRLARTGPARPAPGDVSGTTPNPAPAYAAAAPATAVLPSPSSPPVPAYDAGFSAAGVRVTPPGPVAAPGTAGAAATASPGPADPAAEVGGRSDAPGCFACRVRRSRKRKRKRKRSGGPAAPGRTRRDTDGSCPGAASNR